ncbi:hypothetical protein [Agrobacterium pusense]|uniref:hypothetical protein n=1 Tax=Agrobacterium pusense TaxID=648995 RepID=UPI00088CB49C|nr:hypothetical protein [Agrobacterium pusense]WKD47940.1 hypothetical protein M8C82_25565 [Agrobacterium pusense]SDF64087.1 hypothetical protein SAMN05421750_12034 [Agrobacterium pusense]
MDGRQSDIDLDQIPQDEAMAELERLLADPRLRVAERNRQFLKYIAEARFNHGSGGVKAYVIAIDVFGRPESFDGQNDPIVRIEANRLRSGLDQYYDAYGTPGGLRIEVPKGRYVPRFSRIPGGPKPLPNIQETELPFPEPATSGPVAPSEQPLPPAATRRRPILLPLVAAASAVAALGAVVVSPGVLQTAPATLVDKPGVLINMTSDDPATAAEASRASDYLLVALSRFETLRVLDSRQKPLEPDGEGPRWKYRVDLKYIMDGRSRSVWWQVTDARSAEILTAGVESAPEDGMDVGSIREVLVPVVARQLASTRGVISRIETARAGTLGNPCVLQAEAAMDEGMFENLDRLGKCLKATVAADPSDADAKATLSRFLVVARHDASDTEPVDEALALANAAAVAAPGSNRAALALMFARFAAGQIEAALESGRRAIATNPDNEELAAKVALFLTYAGRWEEGAAMARRAAAGTNPPRAAVLTLALDSYRRGDFARARDYAEGINCGDILVRTLRIAATARLSAEEGRSRLAALNAREPDFEENLLANLSARRMERSLARAVVEGVRAAGGRLGGDTMASL